MRGILTSIVLSTSVSSVNAAVIDVATIYGRASGSINAIVGYNGSISNHLSMPDNATFSYFTLELVGFTVTPDIGLPSSLNLQFRGVDYSCSPMPCVDAAQAEFPKPYIGQEVIASGSLQDKLLGYVEGSGFSTPDQIGTGMSWSFGGMDVSATAEFLLTAHGDIAPVPIPAAG